MIKQSSALNKPFLLSPIGKDYLWGGNRLNTDYGKDIKVSPLAETWECSVHPDGISVIGSGEYTGLLLSDLLIKYPQILGEHASGGELPIIVKLIDSDKDLSIQVHPDDEYANVHEDGQNGKSEMWYILDAVDDACIYYGFKECVTDTAIRSAICAGTIVGMLNKVDVSKNQVYYIPAGMVHAIGKGVLVAEIQENSNLTYRVYDYERVDRDGKRRELHIDKAIDVMCKAPTAKPLQPMRVLNYIPGCAKELLCRCERFQVERMILNTERIRSMVEIRTSELSFEVLLCIDGCGSLHYDADMLPFFKGDCIFIPADSVAIKLHGKAEFLKIYC